MDKLADWMRTTYYVWSLHHMILPPRTKKWAWHPSVRHTDGEMVALISRVVAPIANRNYSRSQLAEAEAWRQVGSSADFGQPYPVDLPEDGPAAR